MNPPLLLRALVLLGLAAAPAAAQEGPRLAFRLGAGVSAVPSFFGSDERETGPAVSLSQVYLRFGALDLGDDDPTDVETGFGFRGSFRYVPARAPGDAPSLAGTEDIDAAFELGGGISYAGTWYEAFATARMGVGGHSEVAGELGMDLIARPDDRWELRAGPRITLGTDGYADTYFGTDAYEAGGGVLASGVEVEASYGLTDEWGLAASARYDRLQQDAARSPVSAEDDQVSATLELTRRFDFRF